VTLSLDPRDLMREIRASGKARDTRREGIREMLDKFPGSWWNGVQGQDSEFDPENAGFELVSYLSTQLVWSNPRVNVSTRRPVTQQEVAEAMQFGMNRWIQDSDFKTTLEDFVVDYLYGWSIALCTLVPRPEAYEAEDPPLWPQVTRISPERAGWDHLCATPRQARIFWHEWWADKDDMLDRAEKDKQLAPERREGWDSAAIEGMATSNVAVSVLGAMIKDRDETSVDRKQLRFISVYLPGHQLPGEPGPSEGFNGTTVVLGCTPSGNGSASDGVIVCPPKPMYGPRWGRYVIGGTYPVPDCPHPLSPILANAGHIDLCTRTGKAISQAIEDYASFVVTSDATLADLVEKGKHRGIYQASQVGDLAGKLVQMTKGGLTQQMLLAMQLVTGRRDRALGMDDVQRGVVTGEGTATEVERASQAASARVAQIKGRFQDFSRRILKTVAYDLYSTDEIVFPAGPEAAEALRSRMSAQGIEIPMGREPMFEGGRFEVGSGATFDDLGLEIEPYSMERPSDATKIKRATFYTQVLPALAQVLPPLVAQGWKPKPLLRAVGEAYEIPNLDDQVDVAQLLEAAKSPFPGEDPMPRLLRDIGAFKAQVGQFARPTAGRVGRLGPAAPQTIEAAPMVQAQGESPGGTA
jgi:hypothetical protein